MKKFEDILVGKGLISKRDLDKAVAMSRQSGKPLPSVLVENKILPEEHVLAALAEQNGLDFVKLADISIEKCATEMLSPKFAAHYAILPVRFSGNTMTIAVCNPLDMSAAEDIRANLGYGVERVVACKDDILNGLRTYYGVGAETVERILAESEERGDLELLDESYDLEKLAEDASVVKLVNQIMQDAINDRATDIHFEAHRDEVFIRRRIDGILYDTNVPKNIKLLYPAIVSRVKLMSGLNIVERRLPQDGRARVNVGRREFDLRVSVVPAIHGEDIVIRILPSVMLFDLAQLGFCDEHLEMLKGLIEEPHGIIFLTGPTGSGKSTTLYACLSRLNTRDNKIITIEDPVEYELKGITQTQIRPDIGLTFSRALRSMLRHDPDIMMVGEVRDRETAEIAIQTAMTGHLVFSTLHTNDAASGAVRLIDMGIDPYLITSTVLSFIAQRLVRVVCDDCRVSYVENGQTLYRGKGCGKCGQRGYFGRMAIAEFLPLVPDIQKLIIAKSSAKNIREKADSLGMQTLLADGWNKILRGITTVEEVRRVTSM